MGIETPADHTPKRQALRIERAASGGSAQMPSKNWTVMSLPEQTAQSRTALAQSATFAMSLGAKELFHTNFVAFLLESTDAELGPLQVAVREALGFPVRPGESPACAVWRERHNLDLVIAPLIEEDEEGEHEGVGPEISRCLVIEAKLKSLPTRAQLQGYMTKRLSLPYPTPESKEKRFNVDADVVRRVLLTPTGVNVHEQWAPVAWESVQKALSMSLDSLSKAPKLRNILEDYAEALNHILHIVRATRQRVEEALQEGLYCDFYEELVHQEFRDLRLHDLTGKVAFDLWVTKLHDRLSCLLQEAGGPSKTVRGATPYVHFSRGQPGLDLETSFGEYHIGVQVQGTQLRRYVSSKMLRPTLEEEVLANAPLMNAWLQGDCPVGQLRGVDEKPIGREIRHRLVGKGKKEPALSTLRAFNAKKFLYSAVDLAGCSMAQVHQAVVDSMMTACTLSESLDAAP